MQAMYDPLDPKCKSISGAVPTRSPTQFSLFLPVTTGSDWVNFCICDGTRTEHIPMERIEQTERYHRWRCSYTPSHPGVFSYYFEAEGEWVPAIIKMDRNLCGTFNYESPLFQLTVYEAGYTTPDWIKGGVLYQIFPDRFCRSGDEKPPMEGRILREDWGGMPSWQPNEEGKILNNDFFGGDLKGIRQKLPYLKELGVTCLYLNPIFYSGSNHRYDTWDYEQVDPWLGDEGDLRDLCADAKAAGIRVILDGVFSHNGDTGRYFDRYGTWNPPGARTNPESPFRSWFTFAPDGSYKSWWGIDTLPEVNELDPAYLAYICGAGGILEKWQRCGVSGWRLDVADELPDGFLTALRDRVKATDPDALIIGEVWEDASTKMAYGQLRPYLWGHQLDSVMNYPFKEAVLRFIREGDGTAFVRAVRTILDHYPKQTVDVLMNFLSTHDVERAITRLAGDPIFSAPRYEQAHTFLTDEEYRRGRVLLRAAFALLYFLPGVPCVYYGDEAGMSGYRDPFNRGCMNWSNGDEEIRSWVAALGALRRDYPLFRDAPCRLSFRDGILTLRRGNLTLTVNKSHVPAAVPGTPLLGVAPVPPEGVCITKAAGPKGRLLKIRRRVRPSGGARS